MDEKPFLLISFWAQNIPASVDHRLLSMILELTANCALSDYSVNGCIYFSIRRKHAFLEGFLLTVNIKNEMGEYQEVELKHVSTQLRYRSPSELFHV